MAIVDLLVHGRNYQVACDSGQEAHVKALAAKYEMRIQELTSKLGNAPETTLLLLAALMAEDEIHTLKKLGNFAAAASSYPAQSDREALEASFAVTLNGIAAHMERMAEKLEQA